MMYYPHSTFVVVLLLLLSPSLLCSKNEAKILDGAEVTDITNWQSIVAVETVCNATADPAVPQVKTYLCGGTVIQKNAVLTAASCFDVLETESFCQDGTPHINIHYTNSLANPTYVVRVAPNNIVFNPSYNQTADVYVNLAIVLTDSYLTVKNAVINNTAVDVNDDRDKVLVAGWGRTVEGGDTSTLLNDGNPLGTAIEKDNSAWSCVGNIPKGIENTTEGSKKWVCVFPDKAVPADVVGPCFGDYGGPALNVLDQSVMGIMVPSTVDYCDNTTKLSQNIWTYPVLRPNLYMDWITETLESHPASSTGALFFSPFLLGLLALAQFFLF